MALSQRDARVEDLGGHVRAAIVRGTRKETSTATPTPSRSPRSNPAGATINAALSPRLKIGSAAARLCMLVTASQDLADAVGHARFERL